MHSKTASFSLSRLLPLVFLVIVSVTGCPSQKDKPTALPVDLMALDPPAVATQGVEPVERAAGVDYRWLSGPEASLRLLLDRPLKLRLLLTVSNPIEGQSVTVLLDGQPVAVFDNLPRNERLTGFKPLEATFEAKAGARSITLKFSRHNNRTPGETFAPEDKRALAVMISSLEITPASP